MAISVLLSLAFGSTDTMDIAQAVNGTLGLVIGTWLTIVFIKIIPLLRDKKRLRPRAISKQAWKLFIPYLFLSVIINVLTGIGIVLFLIPGFIVIARLSYAQILIVRKKIDPLAAIKESVKLTKGKTWVLIRRLVGGIVMIGLPYALLSIFIAVAFASMRSLDLLTFFTQTQPTLLEIVSFQLLDILFIPIFLIYWVSMFRDIEQKA
ncbi:hypothetical protein HON52_03010 [Candidatus Uhrbacteria bacterium]|nr:hypothetical protein [Candidatus Uhrbacteria bacterium]